MRTVPRRAGLFLRLGVRTVYLWIVVMARVYGGHQVSAKARSSARLCLRRESAWSHACWLVPSCSVVVLLAFPTACSDRTPPTIVGQKMATQVFNAPTPSDTTPEDVVTAHFGDRYTWPSGLIMEVAAPTTRVLSTSPGGAGRPVLVVRTTFINNSGTAYDVGSLIGPSVQYAGGSATRLVGAGDNTGGIPTKILQPREKFTLESDFSPVTGPLRIKYRNGLQYPAVVFTGRI
jgi:hypothetical protein